jgi:hypothetical protein
MRCNNRVLFIGHRAHAFGAFAGEPVVEVNIPAIASAEFLRWSSP